MIVEIPVSIGELIDKITILEIKLELIDDEYKLGMVRNELDLLNERRQNLSLSTDLLDLEIELRQVNRRLWHIENLKRAHEAAQTFDNNFIQAARDVYIYNDQRAQIKRRINQLTGSLIQEQKQHH